MVRYYDVIKEPVDLDTIEGRIDEGYYETTQVTRHTYAIQICVKPSMCGLSFRSNMGLLVSVSARGLDLVPR